MADHNIDILIRARDQASKAIQNVNRNLSNLGTRASAGIKTAGRNLLRLGAIAGGVAVGLGALTVKNGLESLATLESAVTSVDGAIKQMGLSGQVTGKQIADWANEIEASVDAAFDDKDITAATATLLRFGKVTPKNLRPAMVVMTDLATKTGSVESASSLLAKALADPTKAAGKLARSGVILTKEQQKLIEKLVKTGKVGQAQKVIIDALARTTKGAAKDSVGEYGDALNELGDIGEDTSRALAQGFLPVIKKAADWLQTKLADPKVQQSIKDIGDHLGTAADKALAFVQNIPWDTVGAGLQVAADFAGKLIGAFTSMPPEVQGTIIALAGLNKLSGGAISGIVGELGKGLIKGVLGMTAGVVNINAGVVKGPGGIPTPGTPGGGPGGGKPSIPAGARGGTAGAGIVIADLPEHNREMARIASLLTGGMPVTAGSHFDIDSGKFIKDGVYQAGQNIKDLDSTADAGFRAGERASYTAGRTAASATLSGASTVTAAVNNMAARLVAAVYASTPSVSVTVGPSSVTKAVTRDRRTSGGTSKGGGGHGGGGSLPS